MITETGINSKGSQILGSRKPLSDAVGERLLSLSSQRRVKPRDPVSRHCGLRPHCKQRQVPPWFRLRDVWVYKAGKQPLPKTPKSPALLRVRGITPKPKGKGQTLNLLVATPPARLWVSAR